MEKILTKIKDNTIDNYFNRTKHENPVDIDMSFIDGVCDTIENIEKMLKIKDNKILKLLGYKVNF